MSNVWLVRAVGKGNTAASFLEKNIIAIPHCSNIDLSEFVTYELLKKAVESKCCPLSPHGLNAVASILFRFKDTIRTDEDIVVTYDRERQAYYIGRVIGDYNFNVECHLHLRSVEWYGSVNRNSLSEATRRSLQSPLSVYKITDSETKNIFSNLQFWEDRYFYGLVESDNRLGLKDGAARTVTVVFDAITNYDFKMITSSVDVLDVLKLDPVQFLVQATTEDEQFSLLRKMEYQYPQQWFKLVSLPKKVGEALGLPFTGSQWRGDNIVEDTNLAIKLCSSEESKRLNYVLDLNRFRVVDGYEIKKEITQINQKEEICHLAYNVGQGTCSALHACVNDEELVYFDVGAGYGVNKIPTLGNLNFKPNKNAVVILSHWHKDHWYAAELVPVLKQLTWITPYQSPISASHVKLAAEISSNGKLFVWTNKSPSSTTIVSQSLTLIKLPDKGDRNNSGIVAIRSHTATGEPSSPVVSTVIPGDASYNSFINHLSNLNMFAVIAPHHGGANAGNPPDPFCDHYHKVVYSYGKENCYDHPIEETIFDHISNRWLNRKDTVNGRLLVAPYFCAYECRAGIEQV